MYNTSLPSSVVIIFTKEIEYLREIEQFIDLQLFHLQ